ncbi:MAG: AAA family ATPase [Saprospiraceae bacterium]|nr:AAA family ATPase [Saprospiraceae bacterium]
MSDFFRHGSRWVRADFHLHTATADEFNKRELVQGSYVQDFVSRLFEQGIQLAVVTNHNKFDKEEFVALKAEAAPKDIRLLAGVEFSAKDGQRGIHLLIVFDDSWYEGELDEINIFLTRAFPPNTSYDKKPYDINSEYNLCETVQRLDKFNKDYFLVMAHVDDTNGLLEEVKGRNLKTLVETPEYKSKVLAFQKSTGAEKRRHCENLMGRKLALVEGSDNATSGIEGVGVCGGNDRKCYLKLGSFSFEAVKFALSHHEERVRDTLPTAQDLYIHEIEIEREGEPLTIPLNSDLNTLIGVRGSGKSSLLETVRFGLGLDANETLEDYKNDIVRRFLGEGNRLLLHLANADGSTRYIIQREWNSRPRVLDARRKVQDGLLPAKLLPTAYYGQKDIEELGKRFDAKYVEDKLLQDKLAELKGQEATLVEAIGQVFEQLGKTVELRAQRDEVAQKIAHLELTIKEFEDSGLQDLVAKELNFNDDESKIDQIGGELEEMAQRLLEVVESYGWDSYLTYRVKEPTNASFFETEVFPIIRDLADKSRQIAANFSISESESGHSSPLDRWGKMQVRFNQLRDSLQEEFRQAKQKIKNPDVDVDTHKRNKRDLDLAKRKRHTIVAELEKTHNLERELVEHIGALEAHRRQMYEVVEEEIQKLNGLGFSFRINVTYQGDKITFKEWLAKNTKGLQKENHVKRIVEAYDDPIQVYRDLNRESTKLAEILQGGNLLAKFRDTFGHSADMLTYRVPDQYEFLYNGKPLERYSIGQKSTALIAFVLAHEDKKLFIIDQPEDDLDNYTVAKEIIGRISELKPSTQFLFATHNPNLLVLGDSEQVVVCSYHDDEGRIDFKHGSIDKVDIQQTAINIMEGGKDAFDRRKNIYQTWKH